MLPAALLGVCGNRLFNSINNTLSAVNFNVGAQRSNRLSDVIDTWIQRIVLFSVLGDLFLIVAILFQHSFASEVLARKIKLPAPLSTMMKTREIPSLVPFLRSNLGYVETHSLPEVDDESTVGLPTFSKDKFVLSHVCGLCCSLSVPTFASPMVSMYR